MGIKISAALRTEIASVNSIPRDEVEEQLIRRSGERCHLCDAEFNLASDNLEVDHDTPVDAGGTNQLGNLNLVHVECNRFKRAQGSRDVRAMLRFRRFYNNANDAVHYTKALEFFNVQPRPSVLARRGQKVQLSFPDGSRQEAAVLEAAHGDYTYEFAFLEVPIEAVFNDDECQPRLIKLNHLFAIAADLRKNPLHEAPTVRIEDAGNGSIKILMFDGQHKALATWLRGERKLAFKLYLNMSKDQAIALVNSIQSKIKKLPLTPFELAAKLSDEYISKLAIYEEARGAEEISEEGFVSYLPYAERGSARGEIKAAALKSVADDPLLLLTRVVEMRGQRPNTPVIIKEGAFQNKLLAELIHTAPLPAAKYRGANMQTARVRERQNIISCLNYLYDRVFNIDANSSENEKERARRMAYQSALQYVSGLIKKVVNNRVVATDIDYAFVEKVPSEESWSSITAAMDRLVSHEVWTANLEASDQMRAFNEALRTNQGMSDAMEGLGLTPAYCLNL